MSADGALSGSRAYGACAKLGLTGGMLVREALLRCGGDLNRLARSPCVDLEQLDAVLDRTHAVWRVIITYSDQDSACRPLMALAGGALHLVAQQQWETSREALVELVDLHRAAVMLLDPEGAAETR